MDANAPAARTWVLLNFPYAWASRIVKNYPRQKNKTAWRIIVSDPNKPWERGEIISGPGKHPTEYKAWKAAAIHMNKASGNVSG
jgi:hypothetical protein